MVEVLSAHLQDVYTKWENSSEPRLLNQTNTHHLSYGQLRRHGYRDRHRKRALARDVTRELNLRDLLEIKEEPWKLDLNKETRPFMGLCCNSCTPNSRNSAVSKIHQEQLVRNVLLVDAQSINSSFWARTFCHLTSVYQLKKYEYPQLAPVVLRDERLRLAIEAAAQYDYSQTDEKNDEVYKGIVEQHKARAMKILYDMRSTLSDFLLRVTSWVLYKLLPCFLTSVVVHPAQLQMLKKASNTGLPLIFLPMHRSHLDYILISFILMNNNIRSPLVAAGDNLRIPVFGWLLRGLGAFFIKRRIDPIQGRRDNMYRAVLHTYMMQCLRAGHNLEFFIEGGRTRTGKACLPRGGLLSVIVDAYMDGTIEDALLVPVSVNYEKLVDGNFVREQLGKPKQMETFGKAIKSIWSVLNSNYGMMRIDFNQPFSLRANRDSAKMTGLGGGHEAKYNKMDFLILDILGKDNFCIEDLDSDSCFQAEETFLDQQQELVQSFHACNKSKFHTSFPDSDGGEDSPFQSIPNGDTKPKKILHSLPSSASLYGTDIVSEEHRQLVESIARHIIYEIKSMLEGVHFVLAEEVKAKTVEVLNIHTGNDPNHCSEQ